MNILRIATHELREMWRSRALPVLAAILGLLLVGAAVVGHARFAADAEQRQRYQALVDRQWGEQPDRHPHRVSHYGFLVFRPRAPLGFFDAGVDSFTGSTLFLEAHRQNTANFSDAAQQDGTRQFGDLTMAMALQVLAPLFVFALTATVVTREREAGTLWLLLSQGPSWRLILVGKLAASIAIVAFLVAPGTLGASLWLAGAQGNISSDAGVRAAWLGVAHAVYLVACAGIGLAVSASVRTTRAALVMLVAVWIALWVVVPRAIPALAASVHPLPSRAAFEAGVERRVRELGDSHNPDDPRFQALKSSYLARYGVSRLEDLPLNYNGIVMYEGEKLAADAYRAHRLALLDTYRRQARLVEWGGILSPLVTMRNVSMALAGVDVAHSVRFDEQAEDYRYAMIQRLNQLHTSQVAFDRDRYEGGAEAAAPTRQRIDRRHFGQIEPFAFEFPSAAWAIRETRFSLIVLLAWMTAAVAAVVLASRRRVTL